jgi:hypothetical protein
MRHSETRISLRRQSTTRPVTTLSPASLEMCRISVQWSSVQCLATIIEIQCEDAVSRAQLLLLLLSSQLSTQQARKRSCPLASGQDQMSPDSGRSIAAGIEETMPRRHISSNHERAGSITPSLNKSWCQRPWSIPRQPQ